MSKPPIQYWPKPKTQKQGKHKASADSQNYDLYGFCQNVSCKTRGKRWPREKLTSVMQKLETSSGYQSEIIIKICENCKKLRK